MEVRAGGGDAIDFGLERLQVSAKTARLELPMLWPDTVLIGKPAFQQNAAYFSEKVKGRSQRVASPIVAAEASRAEDVELFAKHILVAWEGVYDRKKAAVPFSVGAARELLRQLPVHIFDQVRGFFSNPEAFVQAGSAEAGTAEDIAGKSTAG